MMTLQPQPSGITTAPRSWPERIPLARWVEKRVLIVVRARLS